MTIASMPGFSPGVNAAHEVKPMKGGIVQPSTCTGTSLRGNETLTTLSDVSGLPPVAEATTAASMLRAGTTADGVCPGLPDVVDVDVVDVGGMGGSFFVTG